MSSGSRSILYLTFALATASLLVVAGVEGTRLLSTTGWQTHRWLLWNLMLAWIPFLLALTAARLPAPLALPCGLLWLLFLPNAPYMVTDLIHIGRLDSQTPALIDLALIGLAALTALLLGLLSLLILEIAVERRLGRPTGRLFALLTLFLSAVGVYLGRIQRWNSWDLLSRPANLLSSLLSRLADPLAHPVMFGGIGLFTVASLLCYSVTYRLLADRLR